MKIEFLDGSVNEYEKGIKLLDVAKSISEGLARNSIGAIVNGESKGLLDIVEEDSKVEFVNADDIRGKKIMWHTSAHLMALAVMRLYPGTKFAIGPAIDAGFYYDLDSEHRFTPEDLLEIEKEMLKIAKEGHILEKYYLSKEEALDYYKKIDAVYKIDLIENFDPKEKISFYDLAEFKDLCRGPHVSSTKVIKAVKLLNIAGAYWRGDEKNKMLQRIYGITFTKKKYLDEHLKMLEEAKQRDHRKVGKELDLFMVKPEIGSGLPFWLPKGATIRRVIERYIVDTEISLGYEHVYTPVLADVELYKTSGHWDHYHEDMFPPMDVGEGEKLVLRPMNCPHHMEVFKRSIHSYRELPIKIAELGQMHRYEKRGALSGLSRVREMTLNDAHIFVRPDQIKEEFKRVFELIIKMYEAFAIDEYTLRASFRDPENKEKYFDDDDMWNKAEKMLKEAMDELGVEYYEAIGDAAFYGPKLDVQVKNALGNEETLSTIQLDFLLPQRFDLTYVGEDGENNHRPVVIHRGVLSTMERFIAYLIERFKGKFPLWLSPEQVRILPVSDRFNDFCYTLESELKSNGFRVSVDSRSEKVGYKIRSAQVEKVPYMLVIGDKELESGELNVRHFIEGVLGNMTRIDFINKLKKELIDKTTYSEKI